MVSATPNVEFRDLIESYANCTSVGEICVVEVDSEDISTSKSTVGLDEQWGSLQIVIDKSVTFCCCPT